MVDAYYSQLNGVGSTLTALETMKKDLPEINKLTLTLATSLNTTFNAASLGPTGLLGGQ